MIYRFPSLLNSLRSSSAIRLSPRTIRNMSSLISVQTEAAPGAIGPYSQAIKAGNLVFVSGCVPVDPKTSEITQGGIEEQTAQALTNLKAVVEASGCSMNQVAKTTVFLKDMNQFVPMNNVYARFFGDHKPARSTVEVARLPKDVQVEVECIAISDA